MPRERWERRSNGIFVDSWFTPLGYSKFRFCVGRKSREKYLYNGLHCSYQDEELSIRIVVMKKNLVHIVLFEKFIIDYYNSITLFIFADSSSPEIFIRIFTILFVKIMLKKLAGRSFDSPCHISFKSTFKHLHVSRSNAFRIAATTFRPEISVPIRAKS